MNTEQKTGLLLGTENRSNRDSKKSDLSHVLFETVVVGVTLLTEVAGKRLDA